MATTPCELVIVQGGPIETQLGGVGPGVSQRLGDPTGEVIPGLKRLFERDAPLVMLSVMSVILTIQGEEHGTLGFQEPKPMGNWVGLAKAAGDALLSSVEISRTPKKKANKSNER